MNIAIISSTKDPASTNIKQNLINNFDFKELGEQLDDNNIFQIDVEDKNLKLYTIDSELIFAEDLDKKIDADVFIFISKHSGKEERANLTCHPIGNFGKAEHGGKDMTLCPSQPYFLKNMFNELNKNVVNSDYETTMEATHHGPFLEKPLFFVELGSNENYWKDKEGGSIMAKSLMNILSNKTKNYETVFVIGGGHYNHVANKAMLKTDLAVGHICPKYNLEYLNENRIKEAMEKIIPKPKFVLLDWKGLGKEKARIIEILEKNNIPFKRSDQLVS